MSMTGLKALEAQLDDLTGVLTGPQMVEAAEQAWNTVRNQIDANAASEGFFDTGLLLDPATIITVAGMDNEGRVYADAGVFKHDATMIKYGFDPKTDIPRAQVAYWLEFGTQAHYTRKGVRAQRLDRDTGGTLPGDRPGDNLLTEGIKPSKFMSRAFDTASDNAYRQFTENVDKLVEKATR